MTVLNSYTFGNELIRSSRDGNSFADAQGSVTLTDNGAQKFSEYGAFGEVIATDHEESHIGYTGQFFDNETGLMPLGDGERYYSPLLGRFLQEDSYVGMPDSPWSLNRYSHTFNNPFKYVDPSGNEGVISDSLKKNSVSEDRGWWTNFFSSFITGYAYDVTNLGRLVT